MYKKYSPGFQIANTYISIMRISIYKCGHGYIMESNFNLVSKHLNFAVSQNRIKYQTKYCGLLWK